MIKVLTNINPKINSVSFRQKQGSDNSGTGVSQTSKDEAVIKNFVEPPVISDIQLFIGSLTDEQIAQINRTKLLPNNARFEESYSTGSRNGMLREPFYPVCLHVPYLPTINKQTKFLPDGYMVVKNAKGTGRAAAVKIKD